jgi:hypothetical protein
MEATKNSTFTTSWGIHYVCKLHMRNLLKAVEQPSIYTYSEYYRFFALRPPSCILNAWTQRFWWLELSQFSGEGTSLAGSNRMKWFQVVNPVDMHLSQVRDIYKCRFSITTLYQSLILIRPRVRSIYSVGSDRTSSFQSLHPLNMPQSSGEQYLLSLVLQNEFISNTDMPLRWGMPIQLGPMERTSLKHKI